MMLVKANPVFGEPALREGVRYRAVPILMQVSASSIARSRAAIVYAVTSRYGRSN